MQSSANIETMSPRAVPRSRSRQYARQVRETLSALRGAIGAEEYDTAVAIFGKASPEVRKSLRRPLDETFRNNERLFDSGLVDVHHTLDLYRFANRLTRIDPALDWNKERTGHLTEAEGVIVSKVGYANLADWYQEKPQWVNPNDPEDCLDDMLRTLRCKVPQGTEFQTRVRVHGQEKEYNSLPAEVACLDLSRGDYIDVEVSHPRASGNVHIDVVNVRAELLEVLGEQQLNNWFPTGKFYQVRVDGISPQWVERKFAPNGKARVKYDLVMEGGYFRLIPKVSKGNRKKHRKDPGKLPREISIWGNPSSY